MKKVSKKQLIEACEITLQEYKENRHKLSGLYCKLCNLFLHNNPHCNGCPSDIFHSDIYTGCNARLCAADYSNCLSNTEKLRIIEYWTLTISWMKKQSAEILRKKETYKILKKFDKQAYNKYQ